MKETIYMRIGKLLTIKSLVTLVATVVFAVLAIRGDVTPKEFLTVFTVIIGFYFGTQAERASAAGSEVPKMESKPKKDNANVPMQTYPGDGDGCKL